jgi:predicted nucleotidyltransferase
VIRGSKIFPSKINIQQSSLDNLCLHPPAPPLGGKLGSAGRYALPPFVPCRPELMPYIFTPMSFHFKSSDSIVIRDLPDHLVEDVAHTVRVLSSIQGVKRIWLFGSAARKRPMDWRSDLDFAVEGLPPGREYQAWSELDERLSLPLDLVRCEDASPLLLSEIQKGIVLYET